MKPFLFFICLFILLIPTAYGASYVCRDSNGHLYFTDDPMDVPASCRQNMQSVDEPNSSEPTSSTTESPPAEKPTVKANAVDNNTSTAQQATPAQQMIQEEALKQQLNQLQQRAAAAAGKYARGIELKKKASRPFHYGVKAERAEGDKLTQEARQEKQQLLTELDSLSITKQQRADIEKPLASIP